MSDASHRRRRGFMVDARMPEHRHGMNYRARVSESRRNLRGRGLLFHMPGLWQLMFDVERASKERLTRSDDLE